MKKALTKLLASAALIFFSIGASATDYYFSKCDTGADVACVAGSNGNPGTSSGSPKLDFSTFNFSTLAAGDRILLAKGGFWNQSGSTTINNAANNAATSWATVNPIVFDSYTPAWGPGTAQPVLSLSAGSASQIFSLSSTNQKGFTFRNIKWTATGANATSSFGSVYSSSVSHFITFDGNTFDGIGTAINIAVSAGRFTNWKIVNNTFNRSRSNGIIGSADYMLIQNNVFLNNAESDPGAGDHDIYLSSNVVAGGTANPRGTIGVEVSDNYIQATSGAAAPCDSVHIVQHDLFTGLVIQRNHIIQSSGTAAGGCYAIELRSGNHLGNIEGCQQCKINDNVIYNAGYVSINVNNCVDCEVFNNSITKDIAGEWVGIRVGADGNSSNELVSTRVSVYNNSIYFPLSNTTDSYGIQFSRDGTGNVVVGNMIDFAGGSAGTCFFSASLTSAAFAEWNYNLCYAISTPRWATFNGTNYATRSTFNSAVSLDANSLTTDPLLAATPGSGNDYSLATQSGSPVIGACVSSRCSPLGKFGKPIVTARDIGSEER